jgi:hypothetical protein
MKVMIVSVPFGKWYALHTFLPMNAIARRARRLNI